MNEDVFRKITTFIFDIDGVLTDGTVLVLENGLQARRMNIKDGYALQLAVKTGYKIYVVSGSTASPVVERLNKLGITEVHFSVLDKKKFVETLLANNNLEPSKVLYMGDDIPDLPAMKAVGLPVCPADAVTEIRNISSYISTFSGGFGCVRDVIEKVLKANDQWYSDSSIPSA
ncbi:MAG: HAD hydrolase-like protein [Chitinophagaceae bacterium]